VYGEPAGRVRGERPGEANSGGPRSSTG